MINNVLYSSFSFKNEHYSFLIKILVECDSSLILILLNELQELRNL